MFMSLRLPQRLSRVSLSDARSEQSGKGQYAVQTTLYYQCKHFIFYNKLNFKLIYDLYVSY